ncbi:MULTISPECIES: hypothetical protein [Micromonospora]|uniref:hypothetical protein n=1 Tax=Micromonospora TaxID=1873 RepID=UPI0011CD8E00|nr:MULTISPECIES: hypothetical protein [Micromonospora]NES13877.1 hypothetical protein [Micromonospora sp. PPF5-17B]NES37946.1 hypothetical protein [Micromonospora solifontis]NES53977.1 hypothetical protein [Micromonospora sp. PPF5-6]
MELHRSRGNLPLAIICVAAGVMVLGVAVEGSLLRMLVALGVVLIAGRVLVGALRPFRFVIGPEGLDVRRPGLRGTYRWEQFEALAVDESARLVGVPAAGFPPGVRITARHPRDHRPAVELLDLHQVREQPDEVVAALTRWSGGRFTDARTLSAGEFATTTFAFTRGLRGYDMREVDRLVGRAQDALAHGGDAERRAARAEIEQARAAGLEVALRGYDSAQVDAALDALCAALTDTDTPTDRTTPA